MRYSLLCLYGLIAVSFQMNQAKIIVTNPDRPDGFGAQFQTIIYSVIAAELTNVEFAYTPFKNMEHNYDHRSDFIAKKEWLINFIGNFEINTGDALRAEVMNVIQFFEQNLERCVNSQSLKKIKNIFRANKNKNNYFDNQHLNVVIHLRRPNPHDCRIYGADVPDDIFLNIINQLRITYSDKNPLFHVHSQGKEANFKRFDAPDIILHIDETIEDSFTAMVLADILVTSPSSFSYTAGILSEGIVYYMPFWHPPLPHWIPINVRK